MLQLPVSFFAGKDDAVPRAGRVDFPHGFDAFLEVVVDPARAGDDGYLRSVKDVQLWSPATFNGRRAKANVVSLCALVLDYDHGADPDSILDRWAEYECVLHSTFTPGRYRLILPYRLTDAAPVTPAQHDAVWAWAFKRDDRIDGSCKDASRAYYWPTFRITGDAALDGEPVYEYNRGERFDVARLPVDLRAVPASRSPSSRSPTPSDIPTGCGPGSTGGGGADSPYAGIDRVGEAQQREDLALIESRCAFMRRVRADAATLPEPEWYAGLSIISRCVGGDDLAHEVSAPYPGYNESETTEKYERAKVVGPATCAHIRTLSPACRTCPLQVTSPVLLGRNEAALGRHVDSKQDNGVDTQGPAPDAVSPLSEQLAEAEAAHGQARLDEDAAMVAVAKAKKHLRLLQKPTSVASDEDLAAAVKGLNDAQETLRTAQRTRTRAEKVLAKLRAQASLSGLPPGADPVVWGRLHIVKERPAGTVGNVLAILDGDPRWSSRLAFDEFRNEVCLDREPLPEPRATEITAKLSYDYSIDTSTPVVTECIAAVAHKRRFHTVREWLGTLTWDGTPRVRDLLLAGFGIDPSGDEDLIRLIGEKFLLSMVARAMKPGAKVDTILVVVGGQGAFKSTVLEVLGGPWFGRTKLDLLNKDSFMQLRGKWLYEVAEFDSMKRVEASTSKAWLSNNVDTYRAPYARRAEDHPRQTVMAATANEREILIDPTGWRRYHVVEQATNADVGWVGEYREQIFAEARVLYEAGRTWWFDEGTEEAVRLRRMALPYQQVHPWTEVVYDWVLQHTTDKPFTVAAVMQKALGRMTGDLTQSEATLVGSILRNVLECPADRQLVDGKRVTLYRRPLSFPPPAGASAGKVVASIGPSTP